MLSIGSNLTIHSRTKILDGDMHASRIVILNEACLKLYFTQPLEKAAKDLGVSTTALKWLAIVFVSLHQSNYIHLIAPTLLCQCLSQGGNQAVAVPEGNKHYL